MIEEVQTAVGILKLVPEIIQIGKDIWGKIIPPEQLETTGLHDGIVDRTFYSKNYKFSISIPSDEWEFWLPTPQYLATMGPILELPTRAMPIVILSKQMIRLFRPNVNVIIEVVGEYANIDEVIQFLTLNFRSMGFKINDENIYQNSEKQSGAIVATRPYICDTMYHAMHCYLHNGICYTITASYVPMSSYSNKLFGGLQEIMNSFKLLEYDINKDYDD